MLEIRDKDGKVIRRSKNLAGLMRHMAPWHSVVKLVSIERIAGDGGKLCVLFLNGDSCETNFASFQVLAQWICARRNMRGAKLLIDGQEAGAIEEGNPKLQETAFGKTDPSKWRGTRGPARKR